MLHSFERTDFEGDLFDMWILEAHCACNNGLIWLVLFELSYVSVLRALKSFKLNVLA